MDLNKQFKDLDDALDKLKEEVPVEPVAPVVPPPANIPVADVPVVEPVIPTEIESPSEELEKITDFDESDKMLAELEGRLKEIKEQENAEVLVAEKTFGQRLIPFILPVVLTLLALFLTILLLYFFSKSKQTDSVKAITNEGQVIVPTTTSQVVITEEPEPVVAAETPATTTPLLFENGTTTIVNVRFSYDKYNYDNYPRGIYLNETQIFEGDYMDFKIAPTNRSYANDYFFGIDRYVVSLIGECAYTVDEANILVENMNEGNNRFTGKVMKVIDSSKPRIVCGK